MFDVAKAITYLSLLGAVSQTAATKQFARRQAPNGQIDPRDDIPADAKNLPNDCKAIIYGTGMTAAFKTSKPNPDTYFVQLKFSTTAQDVPAVAGLVNVKTINVYTKDWDRGFTAKLSYDQVCKLDKDARVSRCHSISPFTRVMDMQLTEP
jgi:hypothetical protein